MNSKLFANTTLFYIKDLGIFGNSLNVYIYIYIYKQDSALNNLQMLICHEIQTTYQPSNNLHSWGDYRRINTFF